MQDPQHARLLSVERTTSTAHRLPKYDGVCSRLHGHNLRWDVVVRTDEPDESGMAVDLKTISDAIDVHDHRTLLAENDPLAGTIPDDHTLLFSGAPTCERVSQNFASHLFSLQGIEAVDVRLYETDKYGVRATVPEGTDLR